MKNNFVVLKPCDRCEVIMATNLNENTYVGNALRSQKIMFKISYIDSKKQTHYFDVCDDCNQEFLKLKEIQRMEMEHFVTKNIIFKYEGHKENFMSEDISKNPPSTHGGFVQTFTEGIKQDPSDLKAHDSEKEE